MTTIIGVRIDGKPVAFDHVSSTIGIRHGRSSVDDGPLASSAALELVAVSRPGMSSFRVGVRLELDSPDGPAFRGRLSDATLDAAADVLSLTAVGELASVARRPCGRYGFPAQLWADRVRQAFTEAGAIDVLELELGAWNPPLAAVDPDETATLGGVLGELVNDTGAAIADTPDGRVLVQTIDARLPVVATHPIPWQRTEWYASPGADVTDDGGAVPWTFLNVREPQSGWCYFLPHAGDRNRFPLVKGERYRIVFGDNLFNPAHGLLVVIDQIVGNVDISTPLPAGRSTFDFVAHENSVAAGARLVIYTTQPVTAADIANGQAWVGVQPIEIQRLGLGSSPMELPPETVLYAPDWTMVDDVANELELEWALGSFTTRDKASVRAFEPRPASLSTRLSDYADAQRRALEFLNRRSSPDWVVSEATVLARVPVTIGLAVSMTMLPPSSPAPEYVGVIEGWADSIAADEWTTTLALSAPRLSGLGLKWRDPVVAWNAAGPATWHDPSSLDPVVLSPLLAWRTPMSSYSDQLKGAETDAR